MRLLTGGEGRFLDSSGDTLHLSPTANIMLLWEALSSDPERQAMECALYCQSQTPQLASWLKAKIYAELPDTLLKKLLFHSPIPDGRIQALTILSGIGEGIRPKRPSDQANAPAPSQKVGRRKPSPVNGFNDTYHSIFGVSPQIVAAPRERCLRNDPELGRLVIPLHLAHQYRFWIVGREMTREAEGSGCIYKGQLKHRLAFYGIPYTDRHFRRLLAAGEGQFWRQDQKHLERLYLLSWKQVSLNILALAEESGIEVGYNRPGAHQQLIDVSGSLEVWEARLYSGWIAHRDRTDGVSISRACQAALFGRSEKTIRQWEQRHLKGVVRKRTDYEQHPDDQRSQDELYDLQNYIPDHAEDYTAATEKGQVTRRFWQRPNTYTSTVSAHAHRGQARKVRKAVNGAISAETDGGPWRTNYTAQAHYKRVRSRKFRVGEDGDVMQPVHVYMGVDRRSGAGVWELTIPDPGYPYPRTRVNERLFKR